MSGAFALITGEMFRPPEQKTSKNGKAYVSATVRIVDGPEVLYWSVIAFGSAAEELARLGTGSPVSCQGRLKVGIYEKDGETRSSFSLFANNVLALRAAPKAKKPKDAAARPAPAPEPAAQPTFDDGFPGNLGGG